MKEIEFLKFKPILKERVWGGNKLKHFYNKQTKKENIGESWEISDVEGEYSVVSKGYYKGETLRELIKVYKEAILGKQNFKNYGNSFPLLIKIIDAKKPLSIQLHPNDDIAAELHNSKGKTEMWYIMEAETSSNLVVGFKKQMNKDLYLEHLQKNELLEILNVDEVKRGDMYFIPTGRIHAIGAGIVLAEIQQTSDVTYRIYDWNRKDKEGNYRKLHTERALDAIDYKVEKQYSTKYDTVENVHNKLIHCQYFKTNFIRLSNHIEIDTVKDSFIVYICVQGSTLFKYKNKEEKLQCGETLLVPASLKQFSIEPLSNNTELLESFI